MSNRTNVTIEVNGLPVLTGKSVTYESDPETPFEDPFTLKFITAPGSGVVYVQRFNGAKVLSLANDN